VVAEKNSGISAQKMVSSGGGGTQCRARAWLESARPVASPGEQVQSAGNNKK
jgi:hypothetical protein